MRPSEQLEQSLRRADLACVLILVCLAIIYLTGGFDSESEKERREIDNQETRAAYRIKCPSLNLKYSPWDSDLLHSQHFVDRVRQWPSHVKVEQKSGFEVRDGVRVEDDAKNPEVGKKAENRLPLCEPGHLKIEGDLPCNCDPILPDKLRDMWLTMKRGGRWRPDGCRPRERVAIIVPYMDRYAHVHILLNMLIPVLRRQKVDFTFFVIEQAHPRMFNRATLHNIGFLESQKLAEYDCYIFHDVDLVPLDSRIEYRCGPNPRHFPVSIKRQGYRTARKMYNDYFGGIVALTTQQYLRVNGNSNLYFGWGGEDDDLRERVLDNGYKREREDPLIYRFQMLKHERNDKSRGNIDRMLLLRTARDRHTVEGLHSTKYKVHYIKFDKLYTWINVSLNMTELLLTAPDYIESSIKSLMDISKTMS